jgi:hypothetical protein
VTATLTTIEQDLDALDALLAELGGDITEADAEAAIDAWFAEMGEARDTKLNGYARRIQALEVAAEAKRAEERRLAAQRKQDEAAADWMKRRLLSFVQARGTPIKGKPTHIVETTLFKFAETLNGGKQPIRYLVAPLDLPEALREDVITVYAYTDQEAVYRLVHEALIDRMPREDVVLERDAKPREEEVRAALERGKSARAAREEAEAAFGAPVEPHPDEEVFRFAHLEPRGVRLSIR